MRNREWNTRSTTRGTRNLGILVPLVLLVFLSPSVVAQQAEKPATPLAPLSLTLTVGRGELLQFSDEASRVSVSDPGTADAVVVSAHDVVLNGKAPGNTTIMIWHGG